MKTPSKSELLKKRISSQEMLQKTDYEILRKQYDFMKNDCSVSSIIYQSVLEFYKKATDNEHIFSTITSLAGGYLSKKLIMGNPENPIKQVLGYGIQFAVTQILSNITNNKIQKNEK